MSKVFLMGHTGSINRGCEAIVRSTVKLLKASGIYDIHLVTDILRDDKKVELDRICKMHLSGKAKRYNPKKIMAKIVKKLFNSYMPDEKLRQNKIFSQVSSDDIVIVIGGDTYCYDRPVGCYATNRLAKKRGAKTVLWGCSLEKELITDEMLEDLNRYDLICPRECITYETLIEKGISKDKIVVVSDPAFNLDIENADYPKILDEGKTIGINISPIVQRNRNAFDAVRGLISHIIADTGYNIILVPHVYGKGTIDGKVLDELYNEFKDSGKINVISEYLSCTQLKNIISKCRIFIGARTHSTIAAYSTCVPTIVIGYSVKSSGIATDLFGTYENYVLMYDSLTNEKLLAAFEFIRENEEKIRKHLVDVIPAYSSKSSDGIKRIKSMGQFDKKRVLYTDKLNCSGCGACETACPKNCIQMKADEKGFLYPQIDAKNCIECGICEKVCHYKNIPDLKSVLMVYGAVNKNEFVRKNSSSGGVFYALAYEIIKHGGIVFGAGFDEKFNVVHLGIESEDNIFKLMGSKYVQSTIGDTYKKVKEALDSDRWVMFSATPCQINGLRAYLKEDYPKLITMDFICHGVPSPLVWRKYLDEKISEYKSEIKNVSFRSKEHGWKVFSMKIEFENGSTYIGKVTEDKFLRSFLTDIHLRKSCHACNAKGINRVSDFTVADFWGVAKIKPEFNDDTGTSIVIVRGNKAQEFMQRVENDFKLFDCDIETVIKNNPSIQKSVQYNSLENNFYKTLEKRRFDTTFEKFCGLRLDAKLRRKFNKFFK